MRTWLGSSLPTCFSLCCDSWTWGPGVRVPALVGGAWSGGHRNTSSHEAGYRGCPRGRCQGHNQLASCQSHVQRAAARELDLKRRWSVGRWRNTKSRKCAQPHELGPGALGGGQARPERAAEGGLQWSLDKHSHSCAVKSCPRQRARDRVTE